jgi:hypothetical protein
VYSPPYDAEVVYQLTTKELDENVMKIVAIPAVGGVTVIS